MRTRKNTIPSPEGSRTSGRRRRSEQSHQAILDATVELLREVGYSRLTIEGVAARAGVGKATLYRWWPGKSALVIESIGARVQPTPPPISEDTRADLGAAIQATLDTYAGSPLGETLLAVAVEITRDPAASEQVQALIQPHRDTVAAILRQAAARGDLPADVDADLLQDIFAGTVLYRLLVSRTSTESVIDKLLDLLLDGRLPRMMSHDGP